MARDGRPYAVFLDNNLGSDPDYLRRLCRALRAARADLERGRHPRRDRRPAPRPRDGAGRLHRASSSASSRSPTRTSPTRGRRRRPPPTTRGACGILHDNGIQVNGSFVLGFDHDGPDVFERTVAWIEANRLECATFHILTPYPGTPLFRRMEAEGRLLHRDWSLYDTAHVVFRPGADDARSSSPRATPGATGGSSRRGSIWRRRPRDPRAVAPYLAMSVLYKRVEPRSGGCSSATGSRPVPGARSSRRRGGGTSVSVGGSRRDHRSSGARWPHRGNAPRARIRTREGSRPCEKPSGPESARARASGAFRPRRRARRAAARWRR